MTDQEVRLLKDAAAGWLAWEHFLSALLQFAPPGQDPQALLRETFARLPRARGADEKAFRAVLEGLPLSAGTVVDRQAAAAVVTRLERALAEAFASLEALRTSHDRRFDLETLLTFFPASEATLIRLARQRKTQEEGLFAALWPGEARHLKKLLARGGGAAYVALRRRLRGRLRTLQGRARRRLHKCGANLELWRTASAKKKGEAGQIQLD
jgi:hypothetical protein